MAKELKDYRIFAVKAEVHKAVNSLNGILDGIQFDGIISEEEQDEILNWCILHRQFRTRYPFSEIIPVIEHALEDGTLSMDEVKDIQWLCTNILKDDRFESYYDLITSSLQQLHGILHGILADNKLEEVEVANLIIWIDQNEYLRGFYPYDEIYSLLVTAKKDGVITSDENDMLKAFFSNFIDTKMSYNINLDEMNQLREKYSISGVCAVCPDIELENNTFTFTGASSKTNRSELAKIIQQKGGHFSANVTKKTNYLVIGNDGNPCWAFSCYGRKVEAAINLRKNGQKILIIHENDLWDELY